MKKFIFMFVALMSMFTATVNAQKAIETSCLTDNVSVTLQGGVVTPFNDFFENGSTTPVIVLGVDKFVTPWLGFGIEGRTTIGTGESYNPHTAFDAVNVSGALKVNILNALHFNGTKRTFEPIAYASLGWGHMNCSDFTSLSDNYAWEAATINVNGTNAKIGVPTENLGVIRNFMTFRAGLELNFNLGKSKAWAIVVNPSVVYGNIDNGRLDKRLGNFETTAGIRYNFMNENGTRTFKLIDEGAINAKLNELISENEELKNRKPVTNTVEKIVVKEKTVKGTTTINFAQNSSELDGNAKAMLDAIPTTATVSVVGAASPEGTVERNSVLSNERANVVADYLKARGVTVTSAKGDEAGRVAIVTVQ